MLQWEKYSEFARLAAAGLLPGHNVVAYVRSTGQQAADSSVITSKFYNTIATAKNAVVRSGDVIVCLPGHSESVGTTLFSSMTAGTIIAGVGPSDIDSAPTLTWSGATANIAVAAKNCTIANMRLNADADNVTEAITVTAAGFKLIDCYVNTGVATAQDIASFLNFSTGANDGLVLNNVIRGTAGAQATAIKGGTVVDNLRIVGNRIFSSSTNATTGCIAVTAAMTNLFIGHNYISALVAASTATINFADVAATGLVTDNRFGVLADTTVPAGGIILAGTTNILVHFCENYYSDGVKGTSGLLGPTVTT